MDVSFVIFLLVLAVPVIWIPLVGKKWSAIISYVIFGWLLGYGLVGASPLLSENVANSHEWGRVYLLVAAFAAAMILLTLFVYRYRKGKNRADAGAVGD